MKFESKYHTTSNSSVEVGVGMRVKGKEMNSKVWFKGRLVKDFCPTCDSPMPFFPRCYRCGYQGEDMVIPRAPPIPPEERGDPLSSVWTGKIKMKRQP